MERNLTEEEFKILKMLIAKGINEVKTNTLSTLSEDDKIRSYGKGQIGLLNLKILSQNQIKNHIKIVNLFINKNSKFAPFKYKYSSIL